MSRNVMFVYIASRGQGKSMIVSWFACAYSVLYPGVEIVITSGTKGQAKLLVSEKIEKFAEKYPNLKKEIEKVKNNGNETVVLFKNGSSITCVAPTDTSRGFRGNILIVDEYRMVKKDIIDSVLKNFLTSNRSPRFMTLPQYDGFPMDEFEPNREIYMSSAWFKSHWSWNKFKDTVEEMLGLNKKEDSVVDTDKKYFAVSLPYTLPLYHGILPLSKVENDLDAPDHSPVKWSMEMEASFYGQSESAFYLFDDIDKAMRLKNAFIPDAKETIVKNGKKIKYDFMLSEKEEGEKRIIACDVGGTGADNDVYICIRCIPEAYGRKDNLKYYYKKEVVYIKHISVAHSEIKARELKKLYYDFQADFVVMDTNGTSSTLYEACCKVTYDDKEDQEYPAWTAMNHEKLDSIKMDADAEKIIFSVRAFAQFNNDIAHCLKDELKAGRLLLLQGTEEASTTFEDDIEWFRDMNAAEKTQMLQSYYETYMLMIELTNLDAEWSDKGLVDIKKPTGGKVLKDRYSSLAYGVWYCREMEKMFLNKKKKKKSSASLSLYTPKR